MIADLKKRQLFLVLFVLALTIIFTAPALLNAEQPVRKAKTDCSYSVEKSTDGTE